MSNWKLKKKKRTARIFLLLFWIWNFGKKIWMKKWKINYKIKIKKLRNLRNSDLFSFSENGNSLIKIWLIIISNAFKKKIKKKQTNKRTYYYEQIQENKKWKLASMHFKFYRDWYIRFYFFFDTLHIKLKKP